MTAYDAAIALKKKVFWEASTETIRACPENHCLAYREKTSDGYIWKAYRDETATLDLHDKVQRILVEYSAGSTAGALAEEIEKIFRQ